MMKYHSNNNVSHRLGIVENMASQKGYTEQKMEFSVKNLFRKCELQISAYFFTFPKTSLTH